jgi:response regulator RpfG family c-di-GMP phosphodiesterase
MTDSTRKPRTSDVAEDAPLRDTPQPIRTWRVLVVEDVPSLQKLLVVVLSKAGHLVTTADNGVEAVELTARHAFDVVLMVMLVEGSHE